MKEPRTQAGSKVVEQVIDDFEVGIDVQVDVKEVVVTRVNVCISCLPSALLPPRY